MQLIVIGILAQTSTPKSKVCRLFTRLNIISWPGDRATDMIGLTRTVSTRSVLDSSLILS